MGDSKIIDEEQVEDELSDFDEKVKKANSYEEEEDDLDDFNFDNPREQADDHSWPENTFVGTPLYVSPEMLMFNSACYGSDIWALGCIIF